MSNCSFYEFKFKWDFENNESSVEEDFLLLNDEVLLIIDSYDGLLILISYFDDSLFGFIYSS